MGLRLDARATEQWRHRCEVRQVLRWRDEHGHEWVAQWLEGVGRARGAELAARLRYDAGEQWNLGNRGVPGDWRYVRHRGGAADLFR
jgi:hypothetical protein